MTLTTSTGLVGLGTMGSALALNIAEKGFPLVVHNRTASVTQEFLAGAGGLGENLDGADSLEALAAALTPPRQIIIMTKAGSAVDSVIAALKPYLSPGDTLIDAGNADFHDTRRRSAELAEDGFRFIGMGVSGGEEGARHGPSIMVGGTDEAYAPLRTMVEAIAAKYQDTPCAAHLGPDGAGHFVKTVHNGIEYADMQLIAEVYGLMRDGMGQGAAQMADTFGAWDQGPLKSYLIEITGKVLAATDPDTGAPMVDVIMDRAGQKGTGRWTVIEAVKMGQSATIIEAALAARAWSSERTARTSGQEILGGERDPVDLSIDKLEAALLSARVLSYAQGFRILTAASGDYDWHLDHARTAEIWRAGCIIRSALLDDIANAFRGTLPEDQLIFAPAFAKLLTENVGVLREVAAAALLAGHAVPALTAALGFYDTMRQARGSTNLIQAQRDFFGAHGFERLDAEGTHHGPWGG